MSVLPFQAEILLPDVFCYPAEEGVQLCPLLGGKALFQRLEKGALIGLSMYLIWLEYHHERMQKQLKLMGLSDGELLAALKEEQA